MSMLSPLLGQNSHVPANPPNVLFIAVDDLRPELGCYGVDRVHSPRIDALAGSGAVFLNHYVNYPVCGPSRASLLSGVRPSTTRWLRWDCSLDEELPGAVSLPMLFRHHGYHTVSLGKVFNNPGDAQGSWDSEWRPESHVSGDYQNEHSLAVLRETPDSAWQNRGLPYEMADVPDNAYRDGVLAERAIEELRSLSSQDQPFFLAVGFYKPHLPMNAPRKYWDLYEDSLVELPANDFLPQDAPEEAQYSWRELRRYREIPEDGPLDEETARKIIHGYLACVSYVDAQIGRVLDEVSRLGLEDSTIVILWGDHGWFLGEHGFWCKHSNLRRAAHAPLIVRAPGKPAGVRSPALVESVDIYPTVTELAGIAAPDYLHGESLVPLLMDPDLTVKNAVFYRHRRGETILTPTHAYTEWLLDGQTAGRMLFDHRVDPDENVNVSERPENQELIRELQRELHTHIEDRDAFRITESMSPGINH